MATARERAAKREKERERERECAHRQAGQAGRGERGEGRLRERFARTVTQSNHPKAAKTQNKTENRERSEERESTQRKAKKCRQSQHKLPSTPQGGGLLLLPLLTLPPLPQRSSPWDACTNRRATLRWVRPVVQRQPHAAPKRRRRRRRHRCDRLKVNSIICARHAPLSSSSSLSDLT